MFSRGGRKTVDAWIAGAEEKAAAVLDAHGCGALRDKPADLRRLAAETESKEVRQASCALVYAAGLRRALGAKDTDAVAEEAFRLGLVAEQLHTAEWIDSAVGTSTGRVLSLRKRQVRRERLRVAMQAALDAEVEAHPNTPLKDCQLAVARRYRWNARAVRQNTTNPRGARIRAQSPDEIFLP
jgi:hypothetical protein